MATNISGMPPAGPPQDGDPSGSDRRPASCVGEVCRCGREADAKVEEVVFPDDPVPHRHPLTAYLCRDCLASIMGPAALLGRPGA